MYTSHIPPILIDLLKHGELGRLLATLAILALAAVSLKLIQKSARRRSLVVTGSGTFHKNSYVLLKNLVLLAAVIIVITIWASKIAGAALSLAAVAGAMLIISKEFLANLLGSAFLTATRSYRVGDFIEINGVSGKVIDTDLMATILSETAGGSQMTSRMITLPHSLLLVNHLRNLTATGAYAINLLHLKVDPAEDLLLLEAILLQAAQEVCAPWQAKAEEHLRRFEARELMDLPSAAPRVIMELNGAKEVSLSVRYTCRPDQRVNVEQTILRRFVQQRPAMPRRKEE